MAKHTPFDEEAPGSVSSLREPAAPGRHVDRKKLAVDIHGLSKYYPGTVALNQVDLEVSAGEIHALIGGNGSGKSTLIKALCGVVACEPGGDITVNGVSASAADWSKEAARAAGVHAVHQDLGVFLDLTVAENLAIGAGFARHRFRSISWPDVYARAAVLIERFAIDATPTSPMRSLSPANRTLVAIARAVQDGAHHGLLILDEPTASLPQHESDFLLDTLERFAANGQSILYVSHRLDEIMRIADRVSVLRDGHSVGTFDIDDLDEQRLVRLIVGTDLPPVTRRPTSSPVRASALQLRDVSVGPLRNVNLDVAKGEIVGVAGVVGSGRSSLLRGIFGAHPLDGGTMSLDGSPVRFTDCWHAIKAGVAYVPENRADDAAFADLTITANIAMPRISKYWSLFGMRDRSLRDAATELMRSFLVKAPTGQALLATLSGGNQQKVVLARWLGTTPTLLLLDEPSQGVDVGARSEIHELIRQAADQGLAVLIAASDPNELALIVDRAVVLRDGGIAAELTGAELTPERLAIEIHKERGAAA